MWKYWVISLTAGLASALAFLFAGTGTLLGMLLTYFAQLPLFLAALSLGVTASAAASGAAVMTIVLLFGSFFGAFIYFPAKLFFLAPNNTPHFIGIQRACCLGG